MQQPLFWRTTSDKDLREALEKAGYKMDDMSPAEQTEVIGRLRQALKDGKTVLVLVETVVDVIIVDD